MGDLAPNIKNYKVLTPDGYKDFSGVSFMGDKAVWKLTFEQGVILECTEDHKLYQNLIDYKEAKDFDIGDVVLSSEGHLALIAREYIGVRAVFDLVEVEDGHRYYANTVLASNCEFIIHEETLISGLKLVDMEGVTPVRVDGQVRWYKEPSKGHVYLVGLDPAMGTGGDNAAIQIYELPEMIQCGEWMHNKSDIPTQVRVMKSICAHLTDVTGTKNDVYYSVENNSIGEAALINIAELGEENIDGIFLSEPKKLGNVRKFRKGFNTTENSKIAACAKFKVMIESERMIVYSKPLISEMKTFVAKGRSYSSKEGENDDLVMASLLVVRMATVLKDYNPTLEKHMRDHNEQMVAPLPFFSSISGMSGWR